MTSAESKLQALEHLLEGAEYPDADADSDAFWLQVEADCDNATYIISENAEMINEALRILRND